MNSSSRGAYQKWADLTGDPTYEFDNFLPYFMKSADFHPPNEPSRLANSTATYNQSVFSDAGGPLQVGYPAWVNPISSWIGLGLTALGLQKLPGLADGNLFGWGYTAFTMNPQTQTRSSSEASYLREALLETTNLLVYKNTMVKKVLFDSNKQATGLVVDSGGLTYQINATQEVIVSAGAVRESRKPLIYTSSNSTLAVSISSIIDGVRNWPKYYTRGAGHTSPL